MLSLVTGYWWGCGPVFADWIQGYTRVALVAEVFMFSISFSPLILEQILWNGCLNMSLDLLV